MLTDSLWTYVHQCNKAYLLIVEGGSERPSAVIVTTAEGPAWVLIKVICKHGWTEQV